MEQDEKTRLQELIMELDARFRAARSGSAEEDMILRQINGIRRNSELGEMLVDEYHMSAGHPHW